jgi:hypothetical protein
VGNLDCQRPLLARLFRVPDEAQKRLTRNFIRTLIKTNTSRKALIKVLPAVSKTAGPTYNYNFRTKYVVNFNLGRLHPVACMRVFSVYTTLIS